MTQAEEKEALCHQHEQLLYIILHFGAGAMLLAQLRALCLALGLYSTAQAVNRAVRGLKDAGILTRQTWVDNNSDLVMARKYACRYFTGATSQEAATPHRPHTMAPYILTARKIDWLLGTIHHKSLQSIEAINTYLRRHACTMFLRRSELLDYYQRYAPILAAERPGSYRAQLDRLATDPTQRGFTTLPEPPAPAYGEPPPTLATSHRRGIYISPQSTPSSKPWPLRYLRGGRREWSGWRIGLLMPIPG